MEPTTDLDPSLDSEVRSLFEAMAREGLKNVAIGLSAFVGDEITFTSPTVKVTPIEEVLTVMGRPETVAIGVYVAMQGDMDGHIVLLLDRPNALELVDLLMDQPAGTTQDLGSMERSALAEVGNLASARFVYTISTFTGLDVRLSPPGVMEDMVGAMLSEIVASIGMQCDDALLIGTAFQRSGRKVDAMFWVIPSLDVLAGTLS